MGSPRHGEFTDLRRDCNDGCRPMRIADSAALEALCGESLLGTLRGRARRRFERALREEPRVATRLAYWQRTFVPKPSRMIEMQPSARVWRQLEGDLRPARLRPPR